MSWIPARGPVIINLRQMADMQVRPVTDVNPPIDKTHELIATRTDGVTYRVLLGTQQECNDRLDRYTQLLRDVRYDQPPRSPYVETTK